MNLKKLMKIKDSDVYAEMQGLYEQILGYLDFAQRCIDMCKELTNNGFELKSAQWEKELYGRPKKDYQIVVLSDGIQHRFGVIKVGSDLLGIGKFGNGVSGVNGDTLYLDVTESDVLIKKQGDTKYFTINEYIKYVSKPTLDTVTSIVKEMNKWLGEVDSFKKDFISKTNNL